MPAFFTAPATTARVLADIQAGLVTRREHDTYDIPTDTIATDELGVYRELVHLMIGREWAMDSGRYTEGGSSILRLTTLGQGRLLADNPGRYQSQHAISFTKDGSDPGVFASQAVQS